MISIEKVIIQNKKQLKLKKKFRLGEFLAEFIIKSVSFISFVVIVLIFVFVFKETLPIFFTNEKIEKKHEVLQSETYGDEGLTSEDVAIQKGIELSQSLETSGHSGSITFNGIISNEWQPVSANPKYGIFPLLWGSFKVTIIALLIASPLAIFSALFSAVFASKKLKEIIKPIIELLAGFPSVVIGFFALMTIATFSQNFFGTTFRLNSFVGGVALSLAVIPIIYTVTEDAINAIPQYMIEASLALGATKWETALFVILPSATPGIFAALLLGFGRAFGETMIVLMATGNAALSSINLFDPVRTLSATIGAEMAEIVFGDNHYIMLFFIGSLLFIITFLLNALAEFYVRNKLMKRFKGE